MVFSGHERNIDIRLSGIVTTLLRRKDAIIIPMILSDIYSALTQCQEGENFFEGCNIILQEIKLFVKHTPILSLYISSYTNTDIIFGLKEKLTQDQYKIFGTTCFGSFLDMKHCEVQHQLSRCFMVLQLEESHDDSFSIYVNGTTVCFSIREFAVVTGLNCVSDAENFQFNTKMPNRIMDTYFGGAKNVKKKYLLKCFDEKNWGFDNDGDAIKIDVLYFIHTFILSTEKNCTTIPRLHFHLVESGRYSDYPRGKEAFQALIRSISKNMDSQKKYYKIAGMSLAMQVWFNECCSKVDPKIALRVDNRIPRILNWKSIVNQPTYAYMMNDMFNDKGNRADGVDVDKSPLHTDNNEDDSDHFSPTPSLQPKKKHDASVGPSSSPPHKKCKQKLIDPSTVECPIQHVSAIPQAMIPPTANIEIKETVLSVKKTADSKSDDLSALRQDLNSFKDYVMGEFTSLRSLINENFKKISEHVKANQNTERVYVKAMEKKLNTNIHANGHPHVILTGDTLNASTEDTPVCGEIRKEWPTASEVSCVIPPKTGEDVSGEIHVSLELADEDLPSKIPEIRIVIHPAANLIDSTPLPSHRTRRPSRWNSSPYVANFDSAGTSVNLTLIFDKKYPFEDDLISGLHHTLVIQEFQKWVRDGLLAKHDQNVFTLSQTSLCFNVLSSNLYSSHIDIIFYYLRKKGKYNQSSTFTNTTVDCIFKIRIAEIFDKYNDTDNDGSVAKEIYIVCEYIRGYRLLANVPWHTVDNVLIPVNLKDKLHWILAVVSFKERCINVYDSY
ncbi:uncharacterized protein LOC142177031 [Nicotiana tabacum]|uniref:Uncharacterized protein LOC142177031 n=1 Tax=Nicotiana tabacum TaxID=4097 RepID=A0AC58TWI8_TOBAC